MVLGGAGVLFPLEHVFQHQSLAIISPRWFAAWWHNVFHVLRRQQEEVSGFSRRPVFHFYVREAVNLSLFYCPFCKHL